MDVDHVLVLEEEFDALAIEVRGTACAPASSKDEKYPARLHAKKVAKELGVKTGLIYLPGLPSQRFEDSDMAPEFRQRRYFYYMSGVDFPDAAITYDIATERLILWVPYMDPRQALYLGSVPSREECMRKYDIDDYCFTAFAGRYISRHLNTHPGTILYVLHEDQAPKFEHRRGTLTIDHGRLLSAMDAARVTKTPYEVRACRKACDVSSAAHRQVQERFKSLENEGEIEAIFVGSSLTQGAKHQSYAVIAGSGPNAATLHYDANNEDLEGRQTVVLDAGAEWGCYASDITRTLPIGGKFTKEGAAIYAVVDRMQREAIEAVRPGIPYRSLQAIAQKVAAEELIKLRILRGDKTEILRSGVVSALFPHGLGHHVGLEVHDVWSDRLLRGVNSTVSDIISSGAGANRRVGRGKRTLVGPDFCAGLFRPDCSDQVLGGGEVGILAENMILTIEPGIYFNRAYIEAFIEDQSERAKHVNKEVLEKYYGVGGVRIEDVILVTEDGYENLSTAAPKGKEALDIINRKIA